MASLFAEHPLYIEYYNTFSINNQYAYTYATRFRELNGDFEL